MELSDLNWFDMAVIAIVLVSSLLAFFRGFLKALFSLITWVGAAVFALYFASPTEEYLSNFFANEKAVKIASYVIVFLVVFIILAIINSKLLYLIRSYRKSFLDKSLGLAFGFVRGLLIVCLFFFCISTVSKMLEYGKTEQGGTDRYGPEFFVKAKSYNTLNYSTEIILAILPDGLQEYMVNQVTEVKDKVVKSMTEGAAQSQTPRALTKDEMKMIAKVKSALPDEAYDVIREKYKSKGDELSELDKLAIFRDILEAYQESLSKGDIEDSKAVSEESVKLLDNVLNGTEIEKNELPEGEGTGYKELNIKQMERLIDSVNETDEAK